MPICQKCGDYYPVKAKIDGKERDFRRRKHCLNCSPFGKRNLCGPKPKLGKKMKGNVIEVVCKTCNKVFITKNAQHECPKCKSRKQRNKKRTRAIEELGKKCFKCGYDKCRDALDFHHRDPNEKKMTLSGNWEKSWKIIYEEILKCDLLCSNCHRELHAKMQ